MYNSNRKDDIAVYIMENMQLEKHSISADKGLHALLELMAKMA